VRRKEHYWSLFHTTEKNQLNDLRSDQVEAVYAAIPKSQRKEWLIWKEGMPTWKPFDEFPALLMGLRNRRDEPVTVPPATPGAREAVQVIDDSVGNINALSLAEDGSGEDRAAPRYSKRFEIKAQLGDRVFQTTTVDVSMTGMRLKDPIPDGTPKYFNVEIRSGDKVVPVLCSVIRGKNGAPNFRLRIDVNDHINLLQSLLLST
jgi:hypothetical protein